MSIIGIVCELKERGCGFCCQCVVWCRLVVSLSRSTWRRGGSLACWVGGALSRVAGSPSGRGLGSLQLLQRQSHSWQLLPPFLDVDSDCQELAPKFPFPQRLTLGAGPSPLPPLFLFLDTLIHFQTIGVPDTQTGASEDIMARLTKVESHQGSDTWTTSAQRCLF